MADGDSSVLFDTYLERREALLRFFTMRTGSQAQAQDIVQDIYLKLSGLDADAIAAVRNPAAFLYRLGSNLMLDRIKQDRRGMSRDEAWRRGQSIDTPDGAAADLTPADEALAAKQQLERLIDAVDELTPPVRRAFRLHKLEGLSHVETATAMGISRSAIEKHISTALKHLMRRLE